MVGLTELQLRRVQIIGALIVMSCGGEAPPTDAPPPPDAERARDAQLSCDELGERWNQLVGNLRGCETADDCKVVFDALNCDSPGPDGPGPNACPSSVNAMAYDVSEAAAVAQEYVERGCDPGVTLCGPSTGLDCIGAVCTLEYSNCP